MGEHTVELQDGLAVGEDRLTQAVLREATAGDIIDAQAEGERVVHAPGQDGQSEPQLVASPSMTAVHVLRRQVVRLEGGRSPYHGPLSLADMRRLTPTDLALLQDGADQLDQAAASEMARREVAQRGRDDQAGGDG